MCVCRHPPRPWRAGARPDCWCCGAARLDRARGSSGTRRLRDDDDDDQTRRRPTTLPPGSGRRGAPPSTRRLPRRLRLGRAAPYRFALARPRGPTSSPHSRFRRSNPSPRPRSSRDPGRHTVGRRHGGGLLSCCSPTSWRRARAETSFADTVRDAVPRLLTTPRPYRSAGRPARRTAHSHRPCLGVRRTAARFAAPGRGRCWRPARCTSQAHCSPSAGATRWDCRRCCWSRGGVRLDPARPPAEPRRTGSRPWPTARRGLVGHHRCGMAGAGGEPLPAA